MRSVNSSVTGAVPSAIRRAKAEDLFAATMSGPALRSASSWAKSHAGPSRSAKNASTGAASSVSRVCCAAR